MEGVRMNLFLNRIRVLLTPRDKWKLLLVVLMMVIAAVMELAGFGILLPVATVFLRPAWMENAGVQQILHVFGLTDRTRFVLAGVGLIAGIFTLKTLFSYWTVRVQSCFVYRKVQELAGRLYRNYLLSPVSYADHHPVSEWNAMLDMLGQLGQFVLMPLMTLCTDVILSLMLVAGLLYFIPRITLCCGGFILLIGWGIASGMKKVNASCGKRLLESAVRLTGLRLETMKNHLYLKLNPDPEFFYRKHDAECLRKTRVEQRIFCHGQVPRLLLEWSAMLMVLFLFGIMVKQGVPAADILLQFSLLIAVLARLLPSFSRIHYALAVIRQYGPVFDGIYRDLTGCPREDTADMDPEPAALEESLEIRDLTFTYISGEKPVICHLNMKIRACECVAVTGKTGCGKSTLAGLVMGLRRPDSGEILADGKDIFRHLHSWRNLIGLVPQEVCLADDTIRNNVAFGIAPEAVDDANVREALAMAQMLSDVEKMPMGLDTVIGENGSLLSGGQRQRIAIARALYRRPRLLILDEATSALDAGTEAAFVQALEAMKGKLTMLVIAHRLSTVERCDKTISLERE